MHKLFEWHNNNWSWWFKWSSHISIANGKRVIHSFSLPKSKFYGRQKFRWILVDGTKWMGTRDACGVLMPFTPTPLRHCTCERRRSCYSHWFECQDEHGIGIFTKNKMNRPRQRVSGVDNETVCYKLCIIYSTFDIPTTSALTIRIPWNVSNAIDTCLPLCISLDSTRLSVNPPYSQGHA